MNGQWANVLYLPIEEVFTIEVQLFQLRRWLLSEEGAQLGYLSIGIIQDSIVHQIQDSSGFKLDFYLILSIGIPCYQEGSWAWNVTSQLVL